MCDIAECLYMGTIKSIMQNGVVEIKVGYIDSRPFSLLVIDSRSGEHLHFPYPYVDWKGLPNVAV